MRIVLFYTLAVFVCAALVSRTDGLTQPTNVSYDGLTQQINVSSDGLTQPTNVSSSGGSDDTEATIVGLVVLGVVMLVAAAIVLWLVARACFGPSLALPHPTYLELSPADDAQRHHHHHHHHPTDVFVTQ